MIHHIKEKSNMDSFVVKNLSVEAGGREVAKNVSFKISPGEIHALVGPNGSGKSSLAYGIFGHPEYRVLHGSAYLGAVNLLALAPEERARAGMFLSFQEPPEIGGVTVKSFLREVKDATSDYTSVLAGFRIDESFLARFLNEGFSGGEKKKSEILQLCARRPKFAILDEIDTGLDIDSLSVIPEILRDLARAGTGILVITHSTKFLGALLPDSVSLFSRGAIVETGGKEVISHLEKSGYEKIISHASAMKI